MNTKEILTSTIVITFIFAGLLILILKGNSEIKSNKETSATVADNINLDETELEIDENGFKKRAEIQNEEEKMPIIQETPKKQPPQMQLKNGVNYQAIIKTSMGDITFDLFEDQAPITVNNFVYLANQGFYDGLIFHRIIPDFMIQGGCPLGNGMGGPDYSFEDEIDKKRHLVRGSLAMANSGPNTNGSQFFIVTKENTPWLDKHHTNFGQIIEGLDIAMEIEKVPTGNNDKPLQDVVITSIEILEK